MIIFTTVIILQIVVVAFNFDMINRKFYIKNIHRKISEYRDVTIWNPPAEKCIKLHENTMLLVPTLSSPQIYCNLLIIISSYPDNFQLREAIRKSWGSYDAIKNNTICVRFFMGITNDNDTQNQINDEYYKYNDIVQVNCTESDKTTKSLLMFKVIYFHYQTFTSFILKTIDSVYINLEPLMNVLPKSRTLFLAGNLQVEEIAAKCTKLCSNKYYPRYLSSSLWLMSLDTAMMLLRTAITTPYFEIEDVYITGYLAEKAFINRTDFNMFTYIKNELNPCVLNKIIISHNMTPNDITILHKKLTDIKLNCSRTICNLPTPQDQPDSNDNVKCFYLNNFKNLIFPQNFCRASSNLLIIITSAPTNNHRRNAVRETWGHLESKNQAQKYFLLGFVNDLKIQKMITQESYIHEDIIQIDFEDTKYNLTLKSILMLKLVTKFCEHNIKYLIKADDDSYINVNYLDLVLNERGLKNKILGLLYIKAFRQYNTTEKWAVPKNIYKKQIYPNYLSGAAYVMDMNVANLLYEKSFDELLFVLEDVFITGMLAKAANVSLCKFDRFTIPQVNNTKLGVCNFSSSVMSHPVSISKMHLINNMVKSDKAASCFKYLNKFHC